ncbi:hypothetical protein MKX01_004105 [Papaver californicum]|nr:hypothetical protein MKX01_004105 [Papaver californicum]
MVLHVYVKLRCFIFLLWLELVYGENPVVASRPKAKPGCIDKCGNVSISYPFGIGDGCFFEESFELTCNNSIPVDHRKPMHGGFYVSEISISDGYMITDLSIFTYCSNNQVQNFGYSIKDSFSEKFFFSATRNKLTAIGCNTYAYLGLNSSTFTAVGCMPLCNKGVGSTNGSCTGSGCCQASVPAGLREFTLTVGSLNEIHADSSSNPCSYAFLVEKNSFEFFSSYLNNFKDNGTERVPVAIGWNVGTETCEEAVRNLTRYACGPNTNCIEGIGGAPGYRCECKSGHEGHPYLNSTTSGHCQDIDECKASPSPCVTGFCINTAGGFECRCPKGKVLILNTNDGISYCSRPPISKILLVVTVSSATSIVIILMLWVGYRLYNRFQKTNQTKLKQDNFKRNGGLLLRQKITSNDGKVERAAKIFVAEELEKTTDNFNPSRIIGKGGFGTVFKGMLSNGEIVAIKKSTLVDETQVCQFINEVAILSQINHRHIVRLLGCCLETPVPLLVYEFVPNGTLSYHLHVREGDIESLLSWKDRVRIACEVAGALAYLHSDAFMPIFHRDIKSTNILLDEKYKAKVSDFGISRSAHIDATHLTTLVQGTFGYLDPEYFHSGQFTDKSDVYSFGIVLVELLTGETAISKIREEEEKSLALYFIKSLKENRLSVLLDTRVLNEGDTDDILVVGKLAKKCLKYVGKKRPTMKEVSLSLALLHEKLSKDSA